LALVVERWDALSDPIRRAIVALVDADLPNSPGMP
jgi:hypothetical protein